MLRDVYPLAVTVLCFGDNSVQVLRLFTLTDMGSLQELNEDILLLIFQLLPFNEIVQNLYYVCKRFYNATKFIQKKRTITFKGL